MGKILPKKILVIRLNAIGDVVLSSVIPLAIKQKYPEYEVHFLTTVRNSKMLKNCSYIDRVIGYESFDENKTKRMWNCIKFLFKERYDLIICLNFTIRCYAMAFFSFPKKIIFKGNKGKSWVENYFNTAKKAFDELTLPDRLLLENDIDIEKQIQNILNQYPKPHIIINPGKCERQVRQGRVWNIEKWETLCDKLLKTYGGTIFVNGSKCERQYHSHLQRDGVVVFSGDFNLEKSCAVLSQADLVISGDSGPIHIASAYNVNTLAILGSTSHDKIKPYGKNGYYIEPRIECKYCWKKKCKHLKGKDDYSPCIESITPDMVTEKISELNLINSGYKKDFAADRIICKAS